MPNFLSGVARAGRGAPSARWICTAVPLPGGTVRRPGGTLGEPGFSWEDPETGEAIAGYGVAQALTARGGARFAIADRAAEVLASIACDSAAPAPVFVGGFAFDPTRTGQGAWEGFPAGRLVLPRLVLREDARGAVALWISKDRAPGCAEIRALQSRFAPAPKQVLPGGHARPARAFARADRWRREIEKLLSAMRAGALEKAVLARETRLRSARLLRASEVVRRLRQEQPGCWIFRIRRGGATFVGATPELLFRRAGASVQTMALAGSAPRGASAREDRAHAARLRSSPKELREHALVVEAIDGALRPLACALARPLAPRIRRLARVQHLETPIRATLHPSTRHEDLLAALHPTPAVCGRPREVARRMLARAEGFDRGWYAGPVGWVGRSGEAVFAVGLRSALLRGKEARLFVGAGIVEGSDPDAEWRETELKAAAMLSALVGAP